MSYSIGDIVKFVRDIPTHSILKGNEAELVLNIVYTTSWLVKLLSNSSQLYFMESDFELVRSKPSLLNNIGQIIPGRIFSVPIASEFKVGEIVKFNGSDEPVLKTGMHLEIQELRPDGDFNCTIVGQSRMLPIMVMRKEIVRIKLDQVAAVLVPSHSCTWKVYTGLSYREDYCDCGLTKNKRGIYE